MPLTTFFTSSLKRYLNTAPKTKKKLSHFWKPTMKNSLNTSKEEFFSIEGSLITLWQRNGQVQLSVVSMPFLKCRISSSLDSCSSMKRLRRGVYSKMPNIFILNFQMEIKSTTNLCSDISLQISQKFQISNVSSIASTTKRDNFTWKTKVSTKFLSKECRPNLNLEAAMISLWKKSWYMCKTSPWPRTTPLSNNWKLFKESMKKLKDSKALK